MSEPCVLFLARTALLSEVFPRLKEAGVQVLQAQGLEEALQAVRSATPQLLLTEPRLEGYEAAELLAALKDFGDTAPAVVVFSDQGTAKEARHYMEAGARDYWLAPLSFDKIRLLLSEPPGKEAAARSLQNRASGNGIIGEHESVRRTMALSRQVAPSRATVLISGESGTGKEMFARYIHQQSPRAKKPFVAVNCAALPEHLLESELFGHEKGAFTGAVHRKPGKFELAHTGTILLDEISEMDLALQAKLLRVLQEGELDRVGGTETVRIDVRVLATTNCDLEARVAEGAFRQDLYFRLNVIPLRLPPLRERGEDVIRLAQHFIGRFSADYGISGLELSQDAAEWLRKHDWTGNVRELQNLMERAVLLAGTGPIRTGHFLLDGELHDLDLEGSGPDLPCQEPSEEASAQGSTQRREQDVPDLVPLEEMERRLILRSLDHTQGNRTQAAKLLGISVRTLRNKLNEYREQGVHA